MTKIGQDKIMGAVIGSARLEGYKGTLKAATTKAASPDRRSPKKRRVR